MNNSKYLLIEREREREREVGRETGNRALSWVSADGLGAVPRGHTDASSNNSSTEGGTFPISGPGPGFLPETCLQDSMSRARFWVDLCTNKFLLFLEPQFFSSVKWE